MDGQLPYSRNNDTAEFRLACYCITMFNVENRKDDFICSQLRRTFADSEQSGQKPVGSIEASEHSDNAVSFFLSCIVNYTVYST